MNNHNSRFLEGKDALGPVHREEDMGFNETDAVPHNLTKFSEMNNSIQVLKTADIIKGEQQMVADGDDDKDKESFPLMHMLNE